MEKEKIIIELFDFLIGLPDGLKVVVVLSIIIILCATYILLKLINPLKSSNNKLIQLLKESIVINKQATSTFESFELENREKNKEQFEKRIKKLEKALKNYRKKKRRKNKLLSISLPFIVFQNLYSILPLLLSGFYLEKSLSNKKNTDFTLKQIDGFVNINIYSSFNTACCLISNKSYGIEIHKVYKDEILTYSSIGEKYRAVDNFILNMHAYKKNELEFIIRNSNFVILKGENVCNIGSDFIYNLSDNIFFSVRRINEKEICEHIVNKRKNDPLNIGKAIMVENEEKYCYENPFLKLMGYEVILKPDDQIDFKEFEHNIKPFVFVEENYSINPDSFYLVSVNKDLKLLNNIFDISTNAWKTIVEIKENTAYIIKDDFYRFKLNFSLHDYQILIKAKITR